MAGRRIPIEATGLYTYPDISIFRGPLSLGRGESATNPKVVIENPSPSTRHYGRDAKFQHYSQMSSIEKYIPIEHLRFRQWGRPAFATGIAADSGALSWILTLLVDRIKPTGSRHRFL